MHDYGRDVGAERECNASPESVEGPKETDAERVCCLSGASIPEVRSDVIPVQESAPFWKRHCSCNFIILLGLSRNRVWLCDLA
jgi:hypothetical protein